jgi:hypothetical protein
MARIIWFALAVLFCVPGGGVLLQMAEAGLRFSLPLWAELVFGIVFALLPAFGMLSRRIPVRATGWAICLMGYAGVANALGPGRDIAEQVAWILFGGVAGAVVGILAPPGKTIVPFHGRRSRRAEADSSRDGSSRPSRLQFSLRTLFVIFAVVGVILGFFSRSTVQVVRQQRAVATVRQLGGGVQYRDHSRSPPLVLSWPEGLHEENSRDSVTGILSGRTWGDAELLALDLEAFPDLKAVFLWSSQVGDAGLERVRDLEKLEGLSVGQRATDSGLSHLKGLGNLRWLRLSGTNVTDAGLLHLKDWPQLEGLDLDGTQVTDAGLAHLKHVPKLRYLNLSGTQVTDAGLGHLKGLPRLRTLTFSGTGITDVGLVHLKDLPTLKELNLNATAVTDRGLVHLKHFPQLGRLKLSGTQISDAGLVHLQKLSQLHYLQLRNTQVSDAALEQFRRTRPDVDLDPQPP